jgi:hypothetical protein
VIIMALCQDTAPVVVDGAIESVDPCKTPFLFRRLESDFVSHHPSVIVFAQMAIFLRISLEIFPFMLR